MFGRHWSPAVFDALTEPLPDSATVHENEDVHTQSAMAEALVAGSANATFMTRANFAQLIRDCPSSRPSTSFPCTST